MKHRLFHPMTMGATCIAALLIISVWVVFPMIYIFAADIFSDAWVLPYYIFLLPYSIILAREMFKHIAVDETAITLHRLFSKSTFNRDSIASIVIRYQGTGALGRVEVEVKNKIGSSETISFWKPVNYDDLLHKVDRITGFFKIHDVTYEFKTQSLPDR